VLTEPEHAGQYRSIEYVSDGRGLIVVKTDRLLAYGLASEVIGTDAELTAAFGASAVTRLDETWSENAARLLSHPIVKGLLIVVFLLAVFIEMTHPGAILPGAIAAVCLVALVLPPLLVSMAAWWPVAAILAGIALIALELLVIPGFGVPGVLGVIGLFGGLIGLFLVTPQGLFPAARQSGDITYGVATVAISAFTAIGLMTLIARHLHALPLFNRLILSNTDDEADGPGLLAAMADSEPTIAPGTLGVSITPLRPSGRVQIDDRVVDAVADGAFLDAGTPVRIVSADSFRVVVEASSGRTT
jgi:membrane-bound serine protease (ClpP class)